MRVYLSGLTFVKKQNVLMFICETQSRPLSTLAAELTVFWILKKCCEPTCYGPLKLTICLFSFGVIYLDEEATFGGGCPSNCIRLNCICHLATMMLLYVAIWLEFANWLGGLSALPPLTMSQFNHCLFETNGPQTISMVYNVNFGAGSIGTGLDNFLGVGFRPIP